MTELDDCFDRTWRTAELIEFSELTPMQKLHAIRVKVYPMLYHLLENSQTTVKHALKKYLQHLELPLRFEFLEGLVILSINGTTYKNPWPMFDRHVQKQSLKQLQKLPK